MLIYLVEDDENIRELVLYTLAANEYQTVGFSKAQEFWQQMKQQKPDMILLDIMLPGEDGISILKKLRNDKETKQLPIIMLSAKSSEYDKVVGLDQGADDYLAKPFGMMELLSRVKALFRRVTMPQPETEKILFAQEIVLDLQKFKVTCKEQEVSLTLKEFDLLKYLLQNKNLVVSRTQLLEQIWGYEFSGETRTVDVHIGSLRQKMGSCGKQIETVRGVGYIIKE